LTAPSVVALVIVAAIAGVVLQVASRPAAAAVAGHRAEANLDRAPEDPRYQQALRLGLSGEAEKASRALLALARSEKGSNTGAWSLYQASVAAKLLQKPAESAAHLAELKRDYPDHPLTARVSKSAGSSTAPKRRSADCGPRSLLSLCERAGIPATLTELTARCATDKHGTTLDRLQRAARQKGFRSEAAHVDAAFLRRHSPSGIAWVNGDHYVAFHPSGTRGQFLIKDANRTEPERVTSQALAKRSQGIVLLLAWDSAELPPVGAGTDRK
jgi:hypothetical protein